MQPRKDLIGAMSNSSQIISKPITANMLNIIALRMGRKRKR